MRPELLEILRCPACRALGPALAVVASLEGTIGEVREVRKAVLRCEGCDSSYEVREGVVQMLPDPDPELADEMAGIDEVYPPDAAEGELLDQMLRSPDFDDPENPAHWLSVRGHLAQLMEWVKARAAHEPSTSWVLDLGVGSGYSTVAVADTQVRAVALDISLNPLAGLGAGDLRFVAGQAYFDRVQADMGKLPFDDGSFQMVTVLAAFHHTSDLARSAAEVRRVLAPGGEFLISGEPVQGLIKNLDHGEHEREEHGWNEGVYTRSDYLGALEDAGFEVDVEFPKFIEDRLRTGRFGQGVANQILGAIASVGWRIGFLRRFIKRVAFPGLQRLFGLPFVARARAPGIPGEATSR